MKLLELKKLLENKLKSSSEADLILFSLFRNSSAIKNFSDLYCENLTVSEVAREAAIKVADERLAGVPLQHLLQNQFFLNHDYFVNKNVLIPRPETEILLAEIFSTLHSPLRFAELGLGSGIISSELLFHYPSLSGVASELSSESIVVAEKNLAQNVATNWNTRLKIIQPSYSEIGFEILKSTGPFDLIVSNPPYVSLNDEIEDQVKNHEPAHALFPPVNPNYFYENFLQYAADLLAPKGFAFFEIPHERADEILSLFTQHQFLKTRIVNDLTGRPRVLVAQLS